MGQEFISVVFDGPAGVGKSTIAKSIAQELGFQYIDTGAMYRTVTLYALEQGIEIKPANGQKMLNLVVAKQFKFQFDNAELRIFHGDRDLTESVRTQEVSRNVSFVAAIPEIRNGLTSIQRELATQSHIVMEGRDIGTVVLPNATYKFFLTASIDTRAERRYLELLDKGVKASLEEIQKEISARDFLDSSREHAPLRKAEDAIKIDTSNLNIEQAKSLILSHIK